MYIFIPRANDYQVETNSYIYRIMFFQLFWMENWPMLAQCNIAYAKKWVESRVYS